MEREKEKSEDEGVVVATIPETKGWLKMVMGTFAVMI